VILRDPVHGLISFTGAREALVMRLMDTKEMQRLRRIRALGLASLAFPGGEHSRFAHAVGSAHVMKRYLERVWALSNELPQSERIDEETELVALAAALVHDVGHGPYSHTFETLLPGSRPHEAWTSQMVLDETTEIHQVLYDIDPQVPAAVEGLIHGRHPINHLARAVSGTFDVDRCDYLLRDSHMTGVRYGTLDLAWLLQSLRLHSSGEVGAPTVLAVDGEKGLTAVEGFFLARLHMYRQVYLHKAVRAAEVMVRALFQRLLEIGAPLGTPDAMAKALRGEELETSEYLSLDDQSLEVTWAKYEQHGDPLLSRLAAGIRHRRLFKSCSLDPRAEPEVLEARMASLREDLGIEHAYMMVIDRTTTRVYDEDQALSVVGGDGSLSPLLEASPLLHGLASESFVQCRAVFPREHRDAVQKTFADLLGGG
jgi:HD superfamily phosphohydrolase